ISRPQFNPRLIKRCSGSQTPEQLRHAMDSSGHHGGGKMMRAGNDVGDDLCVLWIGNTGFENADDGSRAIADTAQPYRFADHRWILVKGRRPESIGED